MENKNVSTYSPLEEKINIYSHLLGVFLSFFALFFLVLKGISSEILINIISFSIFGLSLITLYLASSAYHSSTELKKRFRLKILDHCAIYVLIAGTYTPFLLVVLGGRLGWILFIIIWLIALTGIILKLFFTGRFKIVSTSMYVVMGWLIIFFVKPLLVVIEIQGFYWLMLGGACYTLGAIIYSIKKIAFNHAIFHIFVLLGSMAHFISIYYYL